MLFHEGRLWMFAGEHFVNISKTAFLSFLTGQSVVLLDQTFFSLSTAFSFYKPYVWLIRTCFFKWQRAKKVSPNRKHALVEAAYNSMHIILYVLLQMQTIVCTSFSSCKLFNHVLQLLPTYFSCRERNSQPCLRTAVLFL